MGNHLPRCTLYLGDHWERGYGDLQWRFLQPDRIMPWYFAAYQEASGRTFMAGVKTQPSIFCFWTVDAAGISLWLDFRNGGSPSLPGDRELIAATIVSLLLRRGVVHAQFRSGCALPPLGMDKEQTKT
jgi:alpha-galactosidase